MANEHPEQEAKMWQELGRLSGVLGTLVTSVDNSWKATSNLSSDLTDMPQRIAATMQPKLDALEQRVHRLELWRAGLAGAWVLVVVVLAAMQGGVI